MTHIKKQYIYFKVYRSYVSVLYTHKYAYLYSHV